RDQDPRVHERLRAVRGADTSARAALRYGRGAVLAAVWPNRILRLSSVTVAVVRYFSPISYARTVAGRVRIASNQRCKFGKPSRFCCWRFHGTIHGYAAMSAIE